MAIALLLMVGLSGCASDNAPAGDQGEPTSLFFEPSQMSEELKKEIEVFPEPLPPDVIWFTETPSELSQENTKYEDGVAAGAVAFYWRCAWDESYLSAFDEGDAIRQNTAISMISKWDSLPFYKAHFVDPDQGWRRTVLDPATLGDPTTLREVYNNDCKDISIQHSK